MTGLMQSAACFILGAIVVYLGVVIAKDLARVAGVVVVAVGLAITGLAASALADYLLWQAVLAVVLIAGVGFAVVAMPYFQQHPNSEE